MPLDGPPGVEGVETLSAGAEIVTVRPGDQPDTTKVSVEHRACAFTV